MPPPIYPMLVIDAGNTSVKFARINRRKALPQILATWDSHKLRASHVKKIQMQSGCHTAVASCVVKAITRLLQAAWPDIHIVNAATPLNFSTSVDRRSVGADRLANIAQAVDQFGKNVLVADFGTAATWDVLDSRGNFLGGAIAPGLRTMAQSLATAADQLPETFLTAPTRWIGRNTSEALRAGIVGGYAGMVQHLLAQLAKRNRRLVFTGGDARMVARLTRATPLIDPLWTLKGIAVLGDLVLRQTNKP